MSLCGLLCQLLFFWCLFWPYVYIFNPFENNDQGVTFPHTGWEVLVDWPFLIPVLVFPLILSLACLLSVLQKKERWRQWLEKSLYMGGLLNVAGSLLILVGLLLIYSSADLYITASYDGAHVLTFLLLACGSSASSFMLGRSLRQGIYL